MGIALSPSVVSLPQHNPGMATVLDFLIFRFPLISRDVWLQRVADGKVHWADGQLIDETTAFAPQQRVYYYHEVEAEPVIPFAEEILFQDELLLAAYKPPFLPVTPGGRFIEECLQNRLRTKTGNQKLQALHRIDRATAGLVLFSVEPSVRHQYHRMFETRQVKKTYQALATLTNKLPQANQQWVIKNRLERSGTSFLMNIVEGDANSHSSIRCLRCSEDKALFELHPITGKTHQLRVHMLSLGWPILNDNYYPMTSEPNEPDDFSKPLQLLAQQIHFVDPITKQQRDFSSNSELSLY